MKRQFSEDLIEISIELVNQAINEFGPDGEEKAHAILDAIDPCLKREMLMALINRFDGRDIVVESLETHSNVNRVQAAITLRAYTGVSLSNAKEAIDNAKDKPSGRLVADLPLRQQRYLSADLEKFGFKIKAI